MRAWKRRALELRDRMQEWDPVGAGLTFVQLYRATGESRSVLRSCLAWLEEVGAVTVKLDAAKRRLWRAVPDDDDQAQPRAADSVSAVDVGLDGNLEEVLSSLQ